VSELPNRLPRPPGELERLQRAWQVPTGWRWPTAVNNTTIGLLYIATAFIFLLLGGVLALVMRAQLALPDSTLVSSATYSQLFTMHGTVMMFLFAVPVVEAVAVYLLPNMLGARDLPFPRLSAYAYWAYAFGGFAFFCTIFVGLAPDGGWFMSPPLTGKDLSPGLNADFWLLGIGFIEISAIAGAIELIVGILMTRAPGMSLARMPVYAWSMLVVGVMIVAAFPAVIAGTALLELERALDWPFFIAERGGDPLLWQHLFWFFGHPEVYIIFLPAAGMVSAILPVLVQKPLVGRRAIVIALVAVGAMSFLLWAHHMFTMGLGTLSLSLVSAASLAIAVPAGVQVFSWIGTLWRGKPRADTQTLFMLGFLFTFVMGGLTGVMVAVLPFDWQVHDSHFIVAHLHYVLIGGVLFPLIAAVVHWLPLVNGHRLDERAGRWSFGLVFGGFHLAFFPMHVSGMLGMPRRIATYPAGLGWEVPNLMSSLGAAVLTAGLAVLAIELVRTLRRPEQEHGNPWNAATLEWLATHAWGTRSLPQVADAEPLWQRPQLHEEVEQGRHWLPGTCTGGRETLVTTPVHARLSHLLVLPGDSWLPIVAAFGTAAFFLLLTVHWNVAAFAFGLLAVGCVVAWLWQLDRDPGLHRAEVGEGVSLPVGAHGIRSHSWWAMVVLLVVDVTILASMGFAHVHVALLADVCPPPGAALPSAASMAMVSGAWLASSALLWLTLRRLDEAALSRWRSLGIVAAAALASAAFGLQWAAHAEAGLLPRAQAWSATVAALLAYQGLHTVVIGLLTAYLVARAWSGLVTQRQRATADNSALLWHGSAAQGLVVAWLPHLTAWGVA
jgi:cytochrome c oxidase subunit I+III